MKHKLAYLEGLRGIAAFVVLLCHLQAVFVVDPGTKWYNYFLVIVHQKYIAHAMGYSIHVLFAGELAVYIFWLMSAYVIY